MDEIELLDPTLYDHGFPHELFRELREEGSVHRHRPATFGGGLFEGEADEYGFWCIVGHPEIQQVNRDWNSFSAEHGPTLGRQPRGGAGMLGLDPPEHHRLRQLVSAGFTPRMIAALEERIRHWSTRLLDDIDPASVEFVSEVAYPLPMHVIAEIIGIPERDRPWVFERTAHVLAGLGNSDDIAIQERADAETGELFAYAHELGAEKRANPTDDIWSTIIQAGVAAEDGSTARLSADEVDTFFLILSIAGSETTRSAIAAGVQAVMDDPGELRALQDEPGRWDTMADEILRFTSPVISFARDATADIEVGGVRIDAGERVLMFHPSGNRDRRVFADPDRLDLSRDPNPHVAFGGGGPHYCLGANLAKREIRVLFECLTDRWSSCEPTGPAEWAGPGPRNNVGCTLTRLPVALS